MTPWPISDCEEMSVTSSLGVMRIQALSGMSVALEECFNSDAANEDELIEYPSSKPPPAASEAERKNRRDTLSLLIQQPFSPPRRKRPNELPCGPVDKFRSDKG